MMESKSLWIVRFRMYFCIIKYPRERVVVSLAVDKLKIAVQANISYHYDII